jgi:hypothetical protein
MSAAGVDPEAVAYASTTPRREFAGIDGRTTPRKIRVVDPVPCADGFALEPMHVVIVHAKRPMHAPYK